VSPAPPSSLALSSSYPEGPGGEKLPEDLVQSAPQLALEGTPGDRSGANGKYITNDGGSAKLEPSAGIIVAHQLLSSGASTPITNQRLMDSVLRGLT
jgi:hypothetical protein